MFFLFPPLPPKLILRRGSLVRRVSLIRSPEQIVCTTVFEEMRMDFMCLDIKLPSAVKFGGVWSCF